MILKPMFSKIKKSFLVQILAILSLFVLVFSFSWVSTLAFGTNSTDSITVLVNPDKNTKKLTLTYQIWQTFKEQSHGVYLSLPKNQGGVWTEYTLKSVKRSPEPLEVISEKIPNISNQGLSSDKYEFFKEWNEFRVRIGDKNKTLSTGKYFYEFVVEADYNPDQEYSFTAIHDWTDPVKAIKIIQNEKDLCLNEIKCDPNYSAITLNKGSVQVSALNSISNDIWPYALMLILGFLGIYYAWVRWAKDEFKIEKATSPEFEPPLEVYPWQAAFLVKDGKVSVKETLLSYILWLSNQKILKLHPDGDPNDKKTEMKLELLKDLPTDLLPAVFNNAIKLSEVNGFKDGIYASKINESQDSDKLHISLTKDLKSNYTQVPLSSGAIFGIIFGFGFALVFVIIFGFQALQSNILLGNSFIGFLVLIGVILEILVVIVTIFWSKATREGVELINKVARYKYYLQYVEKYKLDYSNNPNEGVQYYLKSVPYAAAFGILDQFQKYFAKLLPQTNEVENNSFLYASYSHVVFYTPPSDSGSSGGGGGGGSSGGGGSW
jgi:hypothetical protein